MIEECIFLDIEAAGFNSYPVEVGWACTGSTQSQKSFLIYHNTWLETGEWNEEAAQIHKITQNMLINHGIPLEPAANRLNSALKGKNVYSDAPLFDCNWIDQIFDTAKIKRMFSINDQSELFSEIDPIAYSIMERETPILHRAAEDAYRLAKLYQIARYGEG